MIQRKQMKTLLKFGCTEVKPSEGMVDFTWEGEEFWFRQGEHYYDEPSAWHWYEREVS